MLFIYSLKQNKRDNFVAMYYFILLLFKLDTNDNLRIYCSHF